MPSATDLEIRTLPLENDYQDPKSMLSVLQSNLQRGRDFKLAEALVRAGQIWEEVGVWVPDSDDGLNKYLKGVFAAHEALWTRLEGSSPHVSK
ncbi:hypothetical protein BJ742DRAFT_771501 [Cladochytrium replicatum]|nr:hypothetical protein BJ742DRAFT_771501 [Cladochytrium replicatum]